MGTKDHAYPSNALGLMSHPLGGYGTEQMECVRASVAKSCRRALPGHSWPLFTESMFSFLEAHASITYDSLLVIERDHPTNPRCLPFRLLLRAYLSWSTLV